MSDTFPLAGFAVPSEGPVIYLATANTPLIRDAISSGVLGCMAQPGSNRVDPAWTWAADNGRYRAGTTVEKWRASKWLAFLERSRDCIDNCLFAAVPDTVCDPADTFRLWQIWMPVVAELGYKPGYVLQDGATEDQVPLNDLVKLRGTLFIGGSTEFKTGPEAWNWASRVRALGVWVHWGRINSRKRFAMAALDGDSADGTHLKFRPNRYLREAVGWSNTLDFD